MKKFHTLNVWMYINEKIEQNRITRLNFSTAIVCQDMKWKKWKRHTPKCGNALRCLREGGVCCSRRLPASYGSSVFVLRLLCKRLPSARDGDGGVMYIRRAGERECGH